MTSDPGDVSARTRVFGLVGHPVRHSLSPDMYNTLFRRYGLEAVYVCFDVDPRQARGVADAVRTLGLAGVNLTVPFKETCLPYLDTLTKAAQEAGAVNVVTHVDGALQGYNTDGEGLMRSLEDDAGLALDGIEAVVVGTGGSGRAVAAALLDRGARRIALLNRTVSRAHQAAEVLTRGFPDAHIEPGPLDPRTFDRLAEGAALVVNCTAGDAAPRIAALRPDVLGPASTWVDINYWMDDPPHRNRCADLGHRFLTGHGMLGHQAALAFELFTGHPVQPDAVLAILAPEATL
jgi:shikimate dehydrogenase